MIEIPNNASGYVDSLTVRTDLARLRPMPKVQTFLGRDPLHCLLWRLSAHIAPRSTGPQEVVRVVERAPQLSYRRTGWYIELRREPCPAVTVDAQQTRLEALTREYGPQGKAIAQKRCADIGMQWVGNEKIQDS